VTSARPTRNAGTGDANATTYVGIALRWWWVLLGALIGGAVAGYAASSLITPTYQTSATLLVSQQEIPGVTQRNDVETSIMLSNTFTRLITVGPMIERAIDVSGLRVSAGEFSDSISVASPPDSPIIDITASNTDPELAMQMVNILAQTFIASPELQLAGGAGAVTLVAPAEVPGDPVSPQPTLNAMLGAIMAVIAALLLVVLFEHLREQRAAARAGHTAVAVSAPPVPDIPDHRAPRPMPEGAPLSPLDVASNTGSTRSSEARAR